MEDEVADCSASSRSPLMQVTRSGAIMGRRSVRLSRSARLLPIPSSSFSSEAAEAELLEVGVVELTNVLLTEAPPPLPVLVSNATGFILEAPDLPEAICPPGPACP